MRFLLLPVMVSIAALVWSCGEHHGSGHADGHPEALHAPTGEDGGLRTDGGEPWQMDDHTRSMFAAMVDRVGRHSGAGEPARELGSALQQDIDALIRGCTMTGEAHAELHKFLLELMPAVEALATEGGDAQLHDVEELLDSYPEYFR